MLHQTKSKLQKYLEPMKIIDNFAKRKYLGFRLFVSSYLLVVILGLWREATSVLKFFLQA